MITLYILSPAAILFSRDILYKFIVDGKWILDPGNKLWEQNAENTGNSILWIDKD
jgi:hypothetical protein